MNANENVEMRINIFEMAAMPFLCRDPFSTKRRKESKRERELRGKSESNFKNTILLKTLVILYIEWMNKWMIYFDSNYRTHVTFIITTSHIGPQVPSGLFLEDSTKVCYCFHFALSLLLLPDLYSAITCNIIIACLDFLCMWLFRCNLVNFKLNLVWNKQTKRLCLQIFFKHHQ